MWANLFQPVGWWLLAFGIMYIMYEYSAQATAGQRVMSRVLPLACMEAAGAWAKLSEPSHVAVISTYAITPNHVFNCIR